MNNMHHSRMTVLVILVPEAELLVKPFRDDYDPSAAEGMPAHITVLYPFESQPVGSDSISRLQHLFADHLPFFYSLDKISRFPRTLYLTLSPEDPLRELVDAVSKEFPQTPPYGGLFPDVIPHLTVAEVTDPEQIDEIADEFNLACEGQL